MNANNFTEWASSLSGCDGGKLEKSIWVCGIEWGIERGGSVEDYYSKKLPEEIRNGEYKPQEKYPWIENLKHPYGIKVAKLVAVIYGRKVEDYKNFVEKADGSEIFKMNLYPIAFHNTSDHLWKKYGLDKLTGFKEKHLFKTWCFFNRFPKFAEKVKEKEPIIIIGTGISYLTDFLLCFHGCDKNISPNIELSYIDSSSSTNSYRRYFYWTKINEGKTTLFVIPFLGGYYGLNSDELIQKMGNRIKEITKFQSK